MEGLNEGRLGRFAGIPEVEVKSILWDTIKAHSTKQKNWKQGEK